MPRPAVAARPPTSVRGTRCRPGRVRAPRRPPPPRPPTPVATGRPPVPGARASPRRPRRRRASPTRSVSSRPRTVPGPNRSTTWAAESRSACCSVDRRTSISGRSPTPGGRGSTRPGASAGGPCPRGAGGWPRRRRHDAPACRWRAIRPPGPGAHRWWSAATDRAGPPPPEPHPPARPPTRRRRSRAPTDARAGPPRFRPAPPGTR